MNQDIIFYYSDGTDSGLVSPELAEQRGLHDCRHHTIGEDGPHCVDERGYWPKDHAIGPNAQLGTNENPVVASALLETTAPMGGEGFPLMVGAFVLVVVVVIFFQSRKPAPLTRTNHDQHPKV